MKRSNDDLKSVYLPDERHDGKNKIVNGNNSNSRHTLRSNSKLLLSEKDAEQHYGNFQETIAEEDKFNNLMQMSRHFAHQLNNLLTTILANTQLMSLMVKDEELESYLEAVEDAARDAGAAVREFQGSIRTLAGLSSQENVLDGTQR